MKTEKSVNMEKEYDLLVARTADAIRQTARALCSLGRLCAMAAGELWQACAGAARKAKRNAAAPTVIKEREIRERYESAYRKDEEI